MIAIAAKKRLMKRHQRHDAHWVKRAAEEQADRGARSADRAVDRKGLGALLGFGERRRERRERGRGEQRAEDALDRARVTSIVKLCAAATDGGGDGESGEPHVERRSSPPQVTTTARREAAANRRRVRRR